MLPDKMPNNLPWPQITIITPSYNQSQYIEETILSVLMQGYPNLEYIIIDGGSTDGSVEIIKKYASYLSYWESEPDRGQSHAINKGWKRATGEIITYLNSDDTYCSGVLEKVAIFFKNNPDISMVYGDSLHIDEQSRVFGKGSVKEFSIGEFLVNNFIYQPSAFFRKEILECIGYLDESLHLTMDYDLWLRIALCRRVEYLPEVLSNFRFYNNNKSHVMSDDVLPEIFKITKKVYSNQKLPLEVLRIKNRVFAEVYSRFCKDYYKKGRILKAMINAVRSVLLYPPSAIHLWYVFRSKRKNAIDSLADSNDPISHPSVSDIVCKSQETDYFIDKGPLVSVLLPVYNGAKYLNEAIESILNQSYQNLEFVIINDGSTDKTEEIIKTYTDKRIRYFKQSNMGLAGTLNKGIGLAQGKYIARQDADDIALPGRIEKQVKFLENNPEYAMVGTHAAIWVEEKPAKKKHLHPSLNESLKFHLLFHNPFVHSSITMKKEIFNELSGYVADNASQPEDYELWCRISRKYKIHNIPEVLQIYREVGGSICRSKNGFLLNNMTKLCSQNIRKISNNEISIKDADDLAALTHGAFHLLNPRWSYPNVMRHLYKVADNMSDLLKVDRSQFREIVDDKFGHLSRYYILRYIYGKMPLKFRLFIHRLRKL